MVDEGGARTGWARPVGEGGVPDRLDAGPSRRRAGSRPGGSRLYPVEQLWAAVLDNSALRRGKATKSSGLIQSSDGLASQGFPPDFLDSPVHRPRLAHEASAIAYTQPQPVQPVLGDHHLHTRYSHRRQDGTVPSDCTQPAADTRETERRAHLERTAHRRSRILGSLRNPGGVANRTINEHRRATATVLPQSHTNRYARFASFSKRHALAIDL